MKPCPAAFEPALDPGSIHPKEVIAEQTPAGDAQLVQQCVEGSEEAWSLLVDKYRNLIFSIPIRYGLSREDASEIFQEVCLTLLSELAHVREPRTLPAWLIQVTSRKCFQWRRKQARNCAGDVGLSDREIAISPEPTDTVIDELRREQKLREAIAEMPGRCQHLIRMLFFTTPVVPYEQVAGILGLAKGSVGFIRMRCLERLRRKLEEKGFE